MTDERHPRDTDSTRLHHDWEAGSRLSLTVVDAVAAHRAEAPTELAPLYGSIDLEALEGLVDSLDRGDGRVTFTHDGYDVTVSADGEVVVRDAVVDTDPDAAFEAELTRLVLRAAADGVALDGGWTCTDGTDGPSWVVDIARRR
ncbi:HalOD1 output domain-containing protein [Haloarcula onubensis]|uniref:Halobacterial output domain-containing protein n=1 Tax=Haloarcula onubensis TaxID=2950539 RepID=A0ABU2FP97_9EURY|nr:HalOD1 output domain-containing protein [Halomicroarcula sp. S3CR25-11]MDS0282578.1 hypothetical protein [Halomicroarcula sp. S3CR25-11]